MTPTQRHKRVLKDIFCRAMAQGLIRRGGKRFNELADEIREAVRREIQHADWDTAFKRRKERKR